MPSKASLIKNLKLEPHIEGGYFRRTFESPHRTEEQRLAMTSIYYLLTDEAPIGHFHKNRSDIIHFFHSGSPITYHLLSPTGVLTQTTLGPDPDQGHQFQLLVKGGYWKASQLSEGEYGLISEAVCPGFEYSDMQLASKELFLAQYPALLSGLEHLIKV